MNRNKTPQNAGSHRVPTKSAPIKPASLTAPAGAPSASKRSLLSVGLAFHFLAILISFTSVVEPSSLHARLARLLRPYLQITHFGADDRPVYLAHGEPSEQPHRIQGTTLPTIDLDSIDTAQWQSLGPLGIPGLAVSDRLHRWLSTAAMLADNEQSSLVAELLLPLVQDNERWTAIRIVRLPTELNDLHAETETPYLARVVRSGDRVSLVQLQPARLSSQAMPPSPKTEASRDE